MSTNIISYVIDNEENKVIYSKNIDDKIIKDIDQIKSDKKILFIYDKNISNKIILEIKSKLKITDLIYNLISVKFFNSFYKAI